MSDETIKIDELIDKNPISPLQWRVVIICFALAMIDGFDAQTIAYVAPILSDEFSLSPAVMGQLMSAAMVGLMVGALFGSPLADRIGRKPVIIGSVVLMGVFCLLTAYANGTAELFIYRFLTGLGLGGVMPNINILTAEFAPARRRAILMTAMFTGFPIGIIVGGLVAANLIQAFGWESVFITGGILPLFALPVLILMLPESPRFLALTGKSPELLASIINRIAPQAGASRESQFDTGSRGEKTGSIGALFSEGRAPITLLLWMVYFCNLLTMYAFIGWLPYVLEEAGYPLDKAILASVLFSLGGVIGGLVLANYIDRLNAIKTMVVALLAAAFFVAAVGQVTGSILLLLIMLFLAGGTAMGTQFGLNTITSNSYDTNARSTGLGWALAVGRLGTILGPIAVGAALGFEIPLSMLFMVGMVPMLIAAAGVYWIGRVKNSIS